MRPLLVVLAVALGCASAPSAPGISADAGADKPLADTSVGDPDASLDAGMDGAVDVPRDVTRLDRSDASSDATSEADVMTAPVDVFIDPGMCGPAVRRCLCGCGTNATCQNNCIARDVDCGGCLYLAASRCCPEESTRFEECIDLNRCADDACVNANCNMQQLAFNGCFATRQMSFDPCRAEVRGCLGPDYPMVQCVMK